ncbi:MAG: hypothetical protein ACOVP4_14325 [Bacteriovoracaceae bacterium]
MFIEFIPYLIFILCTVWVKPWEKEIKSEKLLTILCIDALSFSSFFSLNFYKIYALFRLPFTYRELTSKQKIFGVLFIGLSLMSGLLFLAFSPSEELWMSGVSFSDSNAFRMLRNQFSLLTNFLFGYELYKQIENEGKERFLKSFNKVAIILAIGILLEVIFKIDLYALFSGGRELLYSVHYDRARGFAFEPRGASLLLVVALFSNLLFSVSNLNFFSVSIMLMLGTFFSKSLSSTFVACVLALFLFYYLVYTKKMKFLIRLFFYFSFVLTSLQFNFFSNYTDHIKHKVEIQDRQYSSSNYESIASKFEIHEAAYLNFVLNNPIYAITGSGGGLSGVASREYILPRDRPVFPKGSTSLPLVGAIYFFAQYGIFSIGLLLIIFSFLKDWSSDGKVFLNLILITAGIQIFYFLPFVVCCCFFVLAQKSIFETKSSITNARPKQEPKTTNDSEIERGETV